LTDIPIKASKLVDDGKFAFLPKRGGKSGLAY